MNRHDRVTAVRGSVVAGLAWVVLVLAGCAGRGAPVARDADASQDLIGAARVVDGHRLIVAGQRLHLWGLSAPDRRQICQLDGKPWPCGEAAADALAQRLAGQSLRCTPLTRAEDGWIEAQCRLGDENLNAWMIREGWALDDPGTALTLYQAEQTEAALSARGLWAGRFVAPWEWGQR
jgi:endonuclease YncB( thermonuclease family)